MLDSAERQLTSEKVRPEIPFDYRLVHLNIDVSAVYPKVTAREIGKLLDMDDTLVNYYLKKYELEPALPPEDQDTGPGRHPYYITDFIREERAWRAWYLTLPAKLNTNQVAEAVGRSYGWTEKTLTALYPGTRQQRTGHRSRFYPRVAVEKLRDITLATAPDLNWYSVPQLIEASGRGRKWVMKHLERAGIQPEIRRHPLTGRDFPYYPPDSMDVLLEALEASPPPAGNWLTVNALAQAIGRSFKWANKRLIGELAARGELRLDDSGAERMHYPPLVLDVLREKSRAEEAARQQRLGRKAMELYSSAA